MKNITLPSNWRLVKLGDYFEFKNGINFSRNDSGYVIEVLGVGDFKDRFYADFQSLSTSKVNEIKNLTKIEQGDLLFVRSNGNKELIGRILYVKEIDRDIYYSGFVIKGSCSNKEIHNEYIARVCSSPFVMKQYLIKGGGSNINNLNQVILSDLDILLPPYNEQKEINSVLSTWDKAIDLKEKLIEAKKKQKAVLMQKLLTGKVRLPGFDKEWVNVELRKILKRRNEKSEIKEGLELYSLTIEDGVTPKSDRYNREFLVKSGNKKYKITKCNDIVYNPANLRFGAIAVNRIEQSVLLSPIYEVLYIKDEKKYDIDFVGQLLTWDRNIKYFSTMAEGTLVERMAVKIDAFLDVAFKFPPSLEEQKAIASILSLADKEICILKKEMISLKKQKKGLMQLLLTGIVRVNTQES